MKTNDETFLRNVQEARDNGFDLVCSECGHGINPADADPYHDMFCSLNPELEENQKLAREWAANRETDG